MKPRHTTPATGGNRRTEVTETVERPAQEFKAYAASRAKGPLEPFSYDPGPLGPEEVEIRVPR